MSIDGKTRPPNIPPDKWQERFERIFRKPEPQRRPPSPLAPTPKKG